MTTSRLSSKLSALPETVTKNIIDFADCKRASDGKSCVRCSLDKLLTDDEISALNKIKCVAYIGTYKYRYAPEIKHSYFYII